MANQRFKTAFILSQLLRARNPGARGRLSRLLQGLTGGSETVSRTEVWLEGSPGEGATPKFKWSQAGFRPLLAAG